MLAILRNIAFFKDNEIKQSDLNEIVTRLKYEHMRTGDIVFSYGDFGEKFYIIIEGSVGVMIPNSKRRKTTVERANFNLSLKIA